MTLTPESEALVALEEVHRLEVAKMQMQIIRYRTALIDAGIDPPDMEGADLLALWESCKRVVEAASVLVATLGTSTEMLSERWRAA